MSATDVNVAHVVRHLYGLDVASAELLSARDFKVRTIDGDMFLLKVAPTGTKRSELEREIRMLIYLRICLPELNCGRIIHTKKWQKIGTLRNEQGKERLVRLFSFPCGRV